MTLEKSCWYLDFKCWCGEPMATDGKQKWCSTKDKVSHEKHDLGGRKDPLRVDNHYTYVRPRNG